MMEQDVHKLDMTLISVFYDAGLNPLRKTATLKAVQHWMEQSRLPDEILFIELGFNGQFTFSPCDFPDCITYIRINGNDFNKYLFQKEHLWNIAAKRASHEKLMFLDSDISPLTDVDWFGKISAGLDKALFTQGFAKCNILSDKDVTTKHKISYTHIFTNGIDVALNPHAAGMCFAIRQQALQKIGYFNYLPFGGGDNLFWHEIIGKGNVKFWFKLFKREYVQNAIQELCQSSKCALLSDVNVDVNHFWHGKENNRSYLQRQVLLMTQLPVLTDIIAEDDNGLLKWTDMNYYFVNIAKNFIRINNDRELANEFICDKFDYLNFEDKIIKFNQSNEWVDFSGKELMDRIFALCKKYKKDPSMSVTRNQEAQEQERSAMKHILQVRFLSQNFHNGWNLLDDELIDKCLSRMVSTLIPSLNNQTNMDFEVVFLINPKLTFNQLYRIHQEILGAEPKFSYQFLPHNQYLQEYIKTIWDENDILVLTRIDDDDFVNKTNVQDTRDIISEQKEFQLILCGYNTGYKYIEGLNCIRQWNAQYYKRGGHAAMFQSMIVDTKKVMYSKIFNPLSCNHTKTLEVLPKDQCDILYKNIDKPDAFIRVVHENSAEFNKNMNKIIQEIKNGENIKVDDKLILKLKEDFAFTLPLDKQETSV